MNQATLTHLPAPALRFSSLRRRIAPGRFAALPTGVYLAALLTACDNPLPPPTLPESGLRVLEFDSVMTSPPPIVYHRIAIQVLPERSYTGGEMMCQVFPVDRQVVATHFRLYDDGGAQVHRDGQGFADSVSHDWVPDDGIYTRAIANSFGAEVGLYRLVFYSPDPTRPDTLWLDLRKTTDRFPTLAWLHHPDSLPSGSAGLLFTAAVQDSDGYDDVAEVNLVVLPTAARFQFTRVDSLTWVWNSVPEVAVGAPTDWYDLGIYARDAYLQYMQQWHQIGSARVWLENRAPQVESVTGPDTVWVTAGRSTDFAYSILVQDPQGGQDVSYLNLVIARRADLDPERDTVVWRHDYYDDGVEVDSAAGDGVFTAAFSADTSSRQGVLFKFTWTPFDRVPQSGEPVVTHLIILPGRERAAFGDDQARPARRPRVPSFSN